MSTLLRAAALLLVAGLLGACGTDGSGTLGDAPSSSSSSSPSAGSSPPTPQDGTPQGTACDEVAAGVAAFNAGDLDETVASFERALPLAEDEDAEAGSRASADLLEAVRYYADLAPEDYPAASLSSPDFARYKAITLGQCVAGLPPVPDDEGGIAA